MTNNAIDIDSKSQHRKPRSVRHGFRGALSDLFAGFTGAPIWVSLAWHDIRHRYQRSLIGPWWITITMGITILALGFLYSQLFKVELQNYLPYLSIGFVVWYLISPMISEACSVFITAEHIIKQTTTPLSFHVYRLMLRNFWVLLHNGIV